MGSSLSGQCSTWASDLTRSHFGLFSPPAFTYKLLLNATGSLSFCSLFCPCSSFPWTESDTSLCYRGWAAFLLTKPVQKDNIPVDISYHFLYHIIHFFLFAEPFPLIYKYSLLSLILNKTFPFPISPWSHHTIFLFLQQNSSKKNCISPPPIFFLSLFHTPLSPLTPWKWSWQDHQHSKLNGHVSVLTFLDPLSAFDMIEHCPPPFLSLIYPFCGPSPPLLTIIQCPLLVPTNFPTS